LEKIKEIWKDHKEEILTYEKLYDALILANAENDERIYFSYGDIYATFCEMIEIKINGNYFVIKLKDDNEELEVVESEVENWNQEIEWKYDGIWSEIVNNQCNKLFQNKQNEIEKKIQHFNTALKLPSLFTN
jgi:hypothetical protein